MLKGAIDHVSSNEIGGWIYSSSGSLRNQTVLAYIDDVCIGAGRVENYREDLAEAGLGDGFLGFKFPVTLRVEEAPLVAVKLEGSDAVIIQSSARLARRQQAAPRTMVTVRTTEIIEWMRARGWLEQSEYDFLRLMSRFGVYDFSLREHKTLEKAGRAQVRDPLAAAQEMFELLRHEKPQVATDVLSQDASLQPCIERLQAGAIEPIVAVWSPQEANIALVEGSHQESPIAQDGLAGAINCAIGPDRLLFVDLRCRLKAYFSGQVRCYSMVLS